MIMSRLVNLVDVGAWNIGYVRDMEGGLWPSFDAMCLGIGEGILLRFQFEAWLPIFYNREEIMLVLLLMD